jgi:hypothetical protein
MDHLVLQRQLRGIGRVVPVECLEDLRPEAGVAPAVIATVDRLPGTEVCRQVAPGGSRPHHPEHAREDGAVVMGGATRGRLLRREQRRDARPVCIGELRNGRSEGLDRERAVRGRLLMCPTCRVTAPGDRLVPAAKGRPGEVDAAAVGGRGEGEQQAADFRHGERDQALSAPFLLSFAWSRVTSK